MFTEPPPTQYDLCFSVFGIPVRVHPAHWILGVFLGARSGGDGIEIVQGILICVGVIFVSILVHELGHAFVMRRFGESPRVSLYWLGGLAISDGGGGVWGGRKKYGRSTLEQVVISAAGPAAGFLLAGIVVAICFASGKSPDGIFFGFIPVFFFQDNELLTQLVWITLFVNILWGLLNLVPVYPLDGGQIARALLSHLNPRTGIEQSLWLSVVSGALLAIGGLIVFKSILMAIMFGMMAYSSFQSIQMIKGGGFGGGFRGGSPW
jgi:Zn-dependent protease